jgi:DNA-binding response OmpR family regulator
MSRKKTILIVDDCKELAKFVCKIIKETVPAYRIISVYTGADAIKTIDEVSPELVVLDISLPDITGYEICETLRNNEKTKDIKILSISGETHKETKQKILESGADEFLEKPFKIKQFLDIINKLVQ